MYSVDMAKLVCTFCGGKPVIAYLAVYQPNHHDEEPSEIIAACKRHIDCLDEYIVKTDPDLKDLLEREKKSIQELDGWEGVE